MTTFQAKLALRYLRGRKLRTTLTLFAIVFGVMIIVGFNGLLPAMQQALQGNLSAVAGQVDLTISSETRGAFDATVADQVRAIPEVTLVAPALVRPLVLPNAQALTASSGSTINTFIVRGVDPAVATEMNHITLAAGRFLHSDDQNTVLIANNLAQETGRGVGDTLSLPAATGVINFTIVGITTGRPPQGSEELFIPLATAQTLFNLPGQINTLEAQFAPGSDPDAVRQAVLDKLGSGFKLGASPPALNSPPPWKPPPSSTTSLASSPSSWAASSSSSLSAPSSSSAAATSACCGPLAPRAQPSWP